MLHIFVDADACPVKQEVYRVAKRYGLRVTLVAGSWMRVPEEETLSLKVVGEGMNAADDWIVEHVEADDIVITADVPLAARCLEKAAYALDRITGIPGVRRKFSGPVFNEFVLEFPRPWADIDRILREKGVLGGIGLESFYPSLRDCSLICVTEKHAKDDIDRLVLALKEALR